jgi:hypothetical protein
MAEMTPEQETHTFQASTGRQLFGGIVIVATCVILAVVTGVQSWISIWCRIVFVLGCILFALLGIRCARFRVQVRGSQLIIRNYFRTRTVNASEVRRITLARVYMDYFSYSYYWVPRVHLAGGGSIRLMALVTPGSPRAAPHKLATTVEEILSLLGVHSPI